MQCADSERYFCVIVYLWSASHFIQKYRESNRNGADNNGTIVLKRQRTKFIALLKMLLFLSAVRCVVAHKHHHSLLEIMDTAKWTEMKVSTVR